MKNLTLLVVDDNAVFRQILIEKFGNPETEILSAEDGAQAISLALDRHPDAILLDCGLPRMTGFEVCRTLRDNAKTRNIPIIMLTVKDNAYDKMEGLKCGADVYLTKPIDLGWLSNRLHALLARA